MAMALSVTTGASSGADRQDAEVGVARAEADRFACPCGDRARGREHHEAGLAAAARAVGRQVGGPGVALLFDGVELDLEDDGEHGLTGGVAQLEHEVGAEGGRLDLAEGRVGQLDRGVGRDVDVDGTQEVDDQRRVVAEHVDERFVRE